MASSNEPETCPRSTDQEQRDSGLFTGTSSVYNRTVMDGTCKACGKSVLFIKEAIYEGFTKTGEALKCSS